MSSHSKFDQPPGIAVWFIGLFTFGDDAESILGDLLEEFSILALQSGDSFARRWYWRQTVKTAFELAVAGFRTAPILTGFAVAGGFLLRKLLGPLVGPVIFSLMERTRIYEHHFAIYVFLASTGIDIAHLIVFLSVGFAVAWVPRGREMVATLTLALIYGVMTIVACIYIATYIRYGASPWRLTWHFADSFAIVIAGAFVRTRRFTAKLPPAHTWFAIHGPNRPHFAPGTRPSGRKPGR